MSAKHRFPFAFTSLVLGSLVTLTGCVGPLACGPAGDCGPVAFSSCEGCGECDGCGEMYVGPWINHPPDSCDPCDSCGNYNGQSCGKCRPILSGFATLWGYRCDDGSCDAMGCDGCDGGCDSCCGDGEVIHEGDVIIEHGHHDHGHHDHGHHEDGHGHHDHGTPNEVEITPAEESSYQPRRNRQIFRSRPDVVRGLPDASNY